MIIERYTITEFSGLFLGTAAITTTPVTEISFKSLSSDKAKMRALEMGFSPAIFLPGPIDNTNCLNDPGLLNFFASLACHDYWFVIQGQTAEPITTILWKESFFDYREPLK